MLNLHSFSRAQISQLLSEWGSREVHARRLWSYLYREHKVSLAEMIELPPRLLSRLQAEAELTSLGIARETAADEGRTRKYLLSLSDGAQIETVQMRYRSGELNKSQPERVTGCLSSQVGCALGCVFCATGQLGFIRDLTAGEIVAQALFVARSLRTSNERLSNLVLMGMGEPLLNYDAVLTALEILHDPGSLAIGAKQITISTVGVIPGIVRLADEGQRYSLAVSLHAATQEERIAIVPAARPWPLDELIAACRYYAAKLQQKIFFEWTLIAGRNDSSDHAWQLAELLAGLPAQVNLIPLNPTSGFAGEPGSSAAVAAFQHVLKTSGIPSSVRQRRGIDIAAGCGQLAGEKLEQHALAAVP
jgi:23S rRNA (adenine2503-C2)-methyltransferase